jgi:hypothetical protein
MRKKKSISNLSFQATGKANSNPIKMTNLNKRRASSPVCLVDKANRENHPI